MKNAIISHLPGDFPWQVHWYDTIDSTNTRAKELAREGAPHGTVLIAGTQTAGRGRMGRSFSSPCGLGLYFSVILRPNCRAEELMHLTCAAGVAACEAVETISGYRPGIKWINDLVAESKKLGGILTELSVDAGTGLVSYAVIGIGINCNHSPSDFSEELQEIAISLKTVTGQQVEIPKLASALIRALYQMDATLLTAKDAIMDRYRKNCVTLGKPVKVIGQEVRKAVALDVDPEGGLVVRYENGSTDTVSSGEVSVRGLFGYI